MPYEFTYIVVRASGCTIVQYNQKIIQSHLEFICLLSFPSSSLSNEAAFACMILNLPLLILIPILVHFPFFCPVWYLGQYVLLLLILLILVFDL